MSVSHPVVSIWIFECVLGKQLFTKSQYLNPVFKLLINWQIEVIYGWLVACCCKKNLFTRLNFSLKFEYAGLFFTCNESWGHLLHAQLTQKQLVCSLLGIRWLLWAFVELFFVQVQIIIQVYISLLSHHQYYLILHQQLRLFVVDNLSAAAMVHQLTHLHVHQQQSAAGSRHF